MINILKFYKRFNDFQLVKSLHGHEIIVYLFFILALGSFIFALPFKILASIRLIDIHIHNVNVAFFDKYIIDENNKITKIENISSYSRMLKLNILVNVEIIFWICNYKLYLIGILAIIPTLYLVFYCVEHFIEREVKKFNGKNNNTIRK